MKIKTGRGTITLLVLVAIYSISMVTSLPGLAISPILGHLETIFKDASKLQLQMLESLPSFIIVPFILLAGRLSLRVNKKKILIFGLSIFFICSIAYPFANKMWLLLLISAILGIGAGMVIPFSTGLVADYFSGKYRHPAIGACFLDYQCFIGFGNLARRISRRGELASALPGILPFRHFLVLCFLPRQQTALRPVERTKTAHSFQNIRLFSVRLACTPDVVLLLYHLFSPQYSVQPVALYAQPENR